MRQTLLDRSKGALGTFQRAARSDVHKEPPFFGPGMQRDVTFPHDGTCRHSLRRKRHDERPKAREGTSSDGQIKRSTKGFGVIEKRWRASVENGEDDEQLHEVPTTYSRKCTKTRLLCGILEVRTSFAIFGST